MDVLQPELSPPSRPLVPRATWFIAAAIGLVILGAVGQLPPGVGGVVPYLLVVGLILQRAGQSRVGKVLGGDAFLCVIGGSALRALHLIGPDTQAGVRTVLIDCRVLDVFITVVTLGGMITVSWQQMMGAFRGYLLASMVGIMASFGFVVLIGHLLFRQSATGAVIGVGLPVLSGGIASGIVPIASALAQQGMGAREALVARMLCPLLIANLFSTILAVLLRSRSAEAASVRTAVAPARVRVGPGNGLLSAVSFYAAAELIGHYTNVSTLAVVAGLSPGVVMLLRRPRFGNIGASVEECYRVVCQLGTAPVLLAVGLTFFDLRALVAGCDLRMLVLSVAAVLGAVVGAGAFGKVVGIPSTDALIVSGLCIANMGGSGDIAVLTASNRMHLIPYAQLSSRLAGTAVVVLATVLVRSHWLP